MTNLKERCDVIVIGAGIGGLTCGALLAEQGSCPRGYCVSAQVQA